MMKNAFVTAMLGIVLCALVLWLSGCSYPGETKAESDRRHKRNIRLNSQEMMEDIDQVLLLDKPSKLSDKKIP